MPSSVCLKRRGLFVLHQFIIAIGDEATIYSSVNDEDLRFRFTNLATGEEIHVLNGTIGESSMEPTMLELGETKYFEMVFPPLEVNQKYRLSKGAEGAKWTFKEVDLSHPGMSFRASRTWKSLSFSTTCLSLRTI